MANLKSSKKDVKRSAKKRAVNQSTKSALKTFIKKVRTAADSELAAVAVVSAVKAIDKAAQKGIIHKNQAARRKSRLAKAANAKAAPVAAA